MLSLVSTGMGDNLRQVYHPSRYVTKPARSTQTCIPLGLLNRVPALIGWSKGGSVTSAGWQPTLCNPIRHVSSHSSQAVAAAVPSYFTAVYTLVESCSRWQQTPVQVVMGLILWYIIASIFF